MQPLSRELVRYQIVPTDNDLLVFAGFPGHHQRLVEFIVFQLAAHVIGDVVRIFGMIQLYFDRPRHLLESLLPLKCLIIVNFVRLLLDNIFKLAPVAGKVLRF